MGTWDAGHFDNDTAADFACALDKAPAEEKADLVRGALMRTITAHGYLDCDEGAEAVAAAALVAAQCQGGDPVTSGYGPKQTVPDLPVELRGLAAEALDRVLAEESELAEGWGDVGPGNQWRQSIDRLRQVLDPRLRPQEEGLFTP